MFTLRKSEFRARLREACHAATSGFEICGLLVDCGHALSLIPIRNLSPRHGSFRFAVREVRRVSAAAKTLGLQIVGTYHSHPVGTAEPGASDVRNALSDSLMLIFDCTEKSAQLWRINGGAPKKLRYRLS